MPHARKLGQLVEEQPVAAADIEYVAPPTLRAVRAKDIQYDAFARSPPPVTLKQLAVARTVRRIHSGGVTLYGPVRRAGTTGVYCGVTNRRVSTGMSAPCRTTDPTTYKGRRLVS
jgi:hypothetical protein